MTNQYKQFDMKLAVLGLFFIIALDEIYGQQALKNCQSVDVACLLIIKKNPHETL